MTTMRRQPHLQATALILREAMARQKIKSTPTVAKLLGVTGSTVFNYKAGRTTLPAGHAVKLGKLLGLDPASITAPPRPGTKTKTKPRPGPKTGPAQQAVALAAAREVLTPPAARTPGPARDPDRGVFGMAAQADGTMRVWLNVSLPHDQGAALLRALLDFNLIRTTPGE